jgi:ABC-2 type transport system ATP-binding protein
MTGVPLIEAQGLAKAFAGQPAVRGVSFALSAGEVACVLGPNGAGKTTTLRMLAGVLEPDAGAARLGGHDVVLARARAQALLGYLPEGAPLPTDLSARLLLRFLADALGAPRARVEASAAAVGLTAVLDRPLATLSKGYRRRAALAGALVHDPPVLLLDEPMDGLDPIQKQQARALIRALAPGRAILISTHALDDAIALADRILLIAGGTLVLDEPARAFAARGAAAGGLEAAFAALTQEPAAA